MVIAKNKTVGGNVEKLQLEAYSTISKGDPVFLYEGKARKIRGDGNVYTGTGSNGLTLATNGTIYVKAYSGYLQAFQINSDLTITFGTAVAIPNISVRRVIPVSGSTFALVGQGTNYYPTARLFSVSGLTITLGTEYILNSVSSYTVGVVNGSTIVCLYGTGSATNVVAGTISGLDITFGTPATLASANYTSFSLGYANGQYVAFYGQFAHPFTVSGTTITLGAQQQAVRNTNYRPVYQTFVQGNSIVCFYEGYSTENFPLVAVLYDTTNNMFKPFYEDVERMFSTASNTATTYLSLKIKSNRLFFYENYTQNAVPPLLVYIFDAGMNYLGCFQTAKIRRPDSILDLDFYDENGLVLLGMNPNNIPQHALQVVFLDRIFCLGIAENNCTAGETCTITTFGGITKALSGLTSGARYYLQDDGTISTTPNQYLLGIALSSNTLYLTRNV